MSGPDRTADDECDGCGSTPSERARLAAGSPSDDVPLGLSSCPHCGACKCAMCDLGDDVECGNCPDEA